MAAPRKMEHAKRVCTQKAAFFFQYITDKYSNHQRTKEESNKYMPILGLKNLPKSKTIQIITQK